MESNHDIILFDGVCNLCRGSVALVVRNDPGGRFRFAARQSPAARALLAKCGGGRVDAASGSPESIVLIQNGTCFDRSEAILRIASRLGFPWRLLGLFRLIPRPLRDRAYDQVARGRYRWFGRRDSCLIPTPDLRARFLDGPEGAEAPG
ncbi:MAG: DUF393 domain-containing protein [Candidatus Eisenbacteria bacterium]|nr:DUF393 domain-containing protein [Candidatus Eisenbacteria bacterium]MCC7141864.1 DUF393 domain-containing protein [Candidatus Eisenbacteria bacterium]